MSLPTRRETSLGVPARTALSLGAGSTSGTGGDAGAAGHPDRHERPVLGRRWSGFRAGRQAGGRGFRQDAPEPGVELLAADAGTKTDTYVSLAGSWFNRDGVDAVFGIPSSARALVARTVAEQRNKVLIADRRGDLRPDGQGVRAPEQEGGCNMVKS